MCFIDRAGGGWIFLSLCSRTLALCLRHALADGIDAISLSLNKEMAKENQPKGLMPFGNPQRKNGAARGPMFLRR
jgi:hypothetical protein